MITTLLLNAIYGLLLVIVFPISKLPDAILPDALSGAILTAGSYITPLNAFVPVYTILIILGLVLGIETFIFTYKIIMWVLRRIPTQS